MVVIKNYCISNWSGELWIFELYTASFESLIEGSCPIYQNNYWLHGGEKNLNDKYAADWKFCLNHWSFASSLTTEIGG